MTSYKVPKIEELLEAGVHYGHQVRRWHPKMEPYIYSARKNIHIIDLEKTEELLKHACDFLYETAKKGKKIIFVGTKKQSREIISAEAKRAGALYITERWLGGTITNFGVIKKNNIDKLISLKKRKETGDLAKYTKKERLLIDREIERLERFVGGIENLNEVPGALFIIDSKREKTAIKEAKKARVPIIALIDTNANPENINYVIPGNDDAIKSILIIVRALTDAVEAGYADFAQNLKLEKSNADAKTKGDVAVKETTAEVSDVVNKLEEEISGEEEETKEKKAAKAVKVTPKATKTSAKPTSTPKTRGRPKKAAK